MECVPHDDVRRLLGLVCASAANCGHKCVQFMVRGVFSVCGCPWALIMGVGVLWVSFKGAKHHLSIEYGPLGEPPPLPLHPFFSHFPQYECLVHSLHTPCSFLKDQFGTNLTAGMFVSNRNFVSHSFQVPIHSSPTPDGPHQTTTVNSSRTKGSHREPNGANLESEQTDQKQKVDPPSKITKHIQINYGYFSQSSPPYPLLPPSVHSSLLLTLPLLTQLLHHQTHQQPPSHRYRPPQPGQYQGRHDGRS